MMILPPNPYPPDDLPEPLEEIEWSPVFIPGYDMFDEVPEHVVYLCMVALLDEYKR